MQARWVILKKSECCGGGGDACVCVMCVCDVMLIFFLYLLLSCVNETQGSIWGDERRVYSEIIKRCYLVYDPSGDILIERSRDIKHIRHICDI